MQLSCPHEDGTVGGTVGGKLGTTVGVIVQGTDRGREASNVVYSCALEGGERAQTFVVKHIGSLNLMTTWGLGERSFPFHR